MPEGLGYMVPQPFNHHVVCLQQGLFDTHSPPSLALTSFSAHWLLSSPFRLQQGSVMFWIKSGIGFLVTGREWFVPMAGAQGLG